jgi:hypothetical protein
VPQPRAIFLHLNFQKRSENEVSVALCLAPQRRAIFDISPPAKLAPHPPL